MSYSIAGSGDATVYVLMFIRAAVQKFDFESSTHDGGFRPDGDDFLDLGLDHGAVVPSVAVGILPSVLFAIMCFHQFSPSADARSRFQQELKSDLLPYSRVSGKTRSCIVE